MIISPNRAGFIILIFAIFLFFFRLGFFPFLDYDEATYALVFSESRQSGDFLTFTRRGQLEIDKPPLLYWLMAGSVELLGENEFAMRLPAAFFGLMAIFGTYLAAWQASKNRWEAILAAAVLLSIGDFIFAARQIRMDVPAAAAIIFGLYFFIRGWENQRWYLGFGLALGAGVLLKSAVGFFVLPIILIFSAVYGKWDWLKSRHWWLGLLLSLGLFMPWHVYESITVPGFLEKYINHVTVSRFTRATAGFGYYPKLLMQFAQPWISVFMIAGLWHWLKQSHFFSSKGGSASGGKNNKLAASSFYSALFIFFVFSMASTKLFYYLEPMYPFMAIFIAAVFTDFFTAVKTDAGKRRWIIALGILFLIGSGSVLWQVFGINSQRNEEYALAREEKEIGLYLGRQQVSNKVYTSNFYNYETIYYYSRGKNGKGEMLKLVPLKETSPEPFFLIVPEEVFRNYELNANLKERAEPVYSGEELFMFEIR